MSQDQKIVEVTDTRGPVIGPLVAGCSIAPPPPWHVQIKHVKKVLVEYFNQLGFKCSGQVKV